MKKIFLIVSIFALSFAMSCTMTQTTSTAGGTSSTNNENGRTSGDGRTPETAIVITPITSLQEVQNLTINVESNILWVFAELTANSKYLFETLGEGDPTLKVYKESQVKSNTEIVGDPQMFDNDSAPNNSDALVVYSCKTSGDYFVQIQLYAGKFWNGVFKYQIK